jgi:CRP/FNR family transcriptional regulator
MAASLALVQPLPVRGAVWFLQQVAGFEACSDDALGALCALFEVRRVRRGAVLWRMGDAAREVMIVRSGVVWQHRAEGEAELSLGYVGRGGVLGLRHGGIHRDVAVAHEDTTLLVVPRAAFDRWLASYPQGVDAVICALDGDRERTERRLALICLHSARARLAGLLLDLADRFGVRDSEGVIVDLRLTHRELAALIGATRETVSVAIVELRDAGLVRTDARRAVLLNVDALREIATT